MFTGIIETTGKILDIKKDENVNRIVIEHQQAFDDLKIGDSISTDGICLTITDRKPSYFAVNLVPETLKRTKANDWEINHEVNLERSLKYSDRVGGHLVQGHVDFVATIIAYDSGNQGDILKLSYPKAFQKNLINKGFVAIDGMSLTIIDVLPEYFSFTLIPHTKAVTIAKYYQKESKVNIEVDLLGKYIENILRHSP